MTSVPSLIIEQSKSGYRYSAEPFFLADFARPKPGSKVLDIGTGCGIIPILLSLREPSLAITAIEIQESLVKLAVDNVRRRGLTNNINIAHADFLKQAAVLRPASFDVIISNPPYGKTNKGRLSPVREKAVARHELSLTLQSLVEGSARLLKPGGKIYLAYPPDRFDEALIELRSRELNPSRFFFAYGHPQAKAQFFLIEALKSSVANCVNMKPHYIYNVDGSLTSETQEIYASFNRPRGSHGSR